MIPSSMAAGPPPASSPKAPSSVAPARLAAIKRHHPDQPEAAGDAHRDLRAANAARYIADLVDQWPPLTPTQRNRLAALLLSDSGTAAPAAATATEGGDDGG